MPTRAAARVCAAALALALFLVVDGFSQFLPLPRRVDSDYYLIWPDAAVAWACLAASVAGVVALWVVVRIAAARRNSVHRFRPIATAMSAIQHQRRS